MGLAVFGPSADAARLEGSKAWAKAVMQMGAIPTARSDVFTAVEPAMAFVDELGGRSVIKADGLAAGKGVTVATDRATAATALRTCLDDRAFGDAGASVLVEELLEGPEVSAFALVDANTIVPLGLSQDFKRVGDGDAGPNTGGMGAYAPLPFVDDATEGVIWDEIVAGTVRTLRERGITYSGLLYTGLMLTAEGPKVLEYNCRFGDPETEVVVPRLVTDLAELLEACATDRLADVDVATSADAAVTVVLASGGYPGSYETGVRIDGLDAGGIDRRRHGVPCRDLADRRYSGHRRWSGGVRDRGRGHGGRGSIARLPGRCADLVRRQDDADGRRGSSTWRSGSSSESGAGRRTDVIDETPRVGVLAASPSELSTMRQAGLILEKFGVAHEIRIMSSSRNPDLVDEYARTAFERGLKVIICSTGLSGHLAAAVAARTVLPVIGVPIATAPQMVGNEALAITAQMPTGVPVATVGVESSVNAAVLAAQIIGIADPEVQAALWRFKDDLAEGLKL